MQNTTQQTDDLIRLISYAVTNALEKSGSNNGPKLLTVKKAAEFMDCSEGTILNWIRDGQLNCYRNGRIIRIKRHDLESVLVPDVPTTKPV